MHQAMHLRASAGEFRRRGALRSVLITSTTSAGSPGFHHAQDAGTLPLRGMEKPRKDV
jgi:hypothetical protein